MSRTVTVIDNDMGWDRIQREMKRFKKSYTAVGYFTSGTNKLAARAYINEVGATIPVTNKLRWWFFFNMGVMLKKTVLKIPARPFMKMTFEANKDKIKPILEVELSQIYQGLSDAKTCMTRVGAWYAGKIKTTITSGNFAANSALTKKKKGSSKPLIHTGEMRNGVQHREFMS